MALTGYYLFVRGLGRRAGAPARRPARARSCAAGTASSAPSSASGCSRCWSPACRGPASGARKVQSLATDAAPRCGAPTRARPATRPPRSTSRCRTATQVDVPWAHGRLRGADVTAARPARTTSAASPTSTPRVQVADGEGLRHPMTVALPAADDAGGRLLGDRLRLRRPVSDERTVHVDRYGGEVVSTYGFDDYPALAKVVVAGHRPARGPQPRAVVVLGLGADVPGRDRRCA